MTWPVRSSYDDYWSRLEKRLRLTEQAAINVSPADATQDTVEDDYAEESLP
jgi:hypothetical protein